MEWLSLKEWSPYLVGIGIGILNCFAFLLSDKPIACSTAYSRTSGMVEKLIRGVRVNQKPYYQKFTASVEWDWMLVLGVIVGSFVSAYLSDQFFISWVPAKWAGTLGHVGHQPIFRWVVSLMGGILIGIGARWANGCTSGHGISGTLQLSVSSWLATLCFFVGGIITAMLIFNVLLV